MGQRRLFKLEIIKAFAITLILLMCTIVANAEEGDFLIGGYDEQSEPKADQRNQKVERSAEQRPVAPAPLQQISVEPPAQTSESTYSTPTAPTQTLLATSLAPETAPNEIADRLQRADYIRVGKTVLFSDQLARLYQVRGYQPVFISPVTTAEGTRLVPNQMAHKLRTILSSGIVERKGLRSLDYWGAVIENRWQSNSIEKMIELELLLSQSLIRLASDLSTGRVDPRAIDTEIDLTKRIFDNYNYLAKVVAGSPNSLLSGIEALEPQHIQYKKLIHLLDRLIEIRESGGWLPIDFKETLKVGMSSGLVPILRQRLIDLGLLSPEHANIQSQEYDQALSDAVKAYQINMKLSFDGVAGPGTFRSLNTSVENRIRQVRANLEKWRWLPRQLINPKVGNRYIFVNLGRQELAVIERDPTTGNETPVLEMRVVIGQQFRRTATMVQSFSSVILNPYWTPPTSIIMKDIIPAAIANSRYFANNRIRVFSNSGEIDPLTVDWSQYRTKVPPYTFRQDPGLYNSLGQVRFNLNNRRAIYMHDTAHDRAHLGKFDQLERFASSGCIRLQKPLELLWYVLKGDRRWTQDEVNKYINNPGSYPAAAIKLGQSTPVYIAFMSVSFDGQGRAQYAPDKYTQDERIILAMDSSY